MVVETRERVITVLDPTAESLPTRTSVAERPGSLDGKVLGLLDNSKQNAGRLLEIVADMLKDQFEIRAVKFAAKPDASKPAPKEVVDKLASECDFAVVAVGD